MKSAGYECMQNVKRIINEIKNKIQWPRRQYVYNESRQQRLTEEGDVINLNAI